MIDVSIVVHLDGRIDLEGDELKLAMWNHDPDRLRDAVNYAGRGRAVWKPRFHVLAVPGPSGYLFNLAALDQRTPCHTGARQAPGESTPDFLVRAMREVHGFSRCLGGAWLPQMRWRARNKQRAALPHPCSSMTAEVFGDLLGPRRRNDGGRCSVPGIDT